MRSRILLSALGVLLALPGAAWAAAGAGSHAFRAPSGRGFRGIGGGRHFLFFGGGGGSFLTILIVLVVIALIMRNRRD